MSGYYIWPIESDATMMLEITNADGTGCTISTPQLSIQRTRQVSGSLLDNYYWNGTSSFSVTPTFMNMAPSDSVNLPGVYNYIFSQSLIQKEVVYTVYYKNNTNPIGFASEIHTFEYRVTPALLSSSLTINVYDSRPSGY